MKRLALVLLPAFALATLQNGHLTMRAGGDSLEVAFKSMRARLLTNNKVEMVLQGSPVTGSWKLGKVNAQANSLIATGKKMGQNVFEVQQVVLKNDVSATWDLEDGKFSGQSDEATFKFSSREVDDIVLKGRVHVDSKLANAKSQTDCAYAHFTIKDKQIAKGEMTGGVKFLFLRTDDKGLVHKTTCTSNEVTIVGQKTIFLNGNVHIVGDEPTLIGELHGSKAQIDLDPSGQPTSIEILGAPGTGSVNAKGGGI